MKLRWAASKAKNPDHEPKPPATPSFVDCSGKRQVVCNLDGPEWHMSHQRLKAIVSIICNEPRSAAALDQDQ